MKLVTSTFAGLIAAGLCAAPLAYATDNSAVETKIKQMEDSWAAAQMEKDHGASAVGDMLATDYAGVGSKGEIRSKSSQIEHMKGDTDTYASSKNDKMDVHVFGADVATVCGSSTETGKDKDGKEFNRSFAWVDTWMQRNGKWECIASAGTPLAQK
jgi:ketosteroid isomerase-like protein